MKIPIFLLQLQNIVTYDKKSFCKGHVIRRDKWCTFQFFFEGGGAAGSEDFAYVTFPTTPSPLIFKAKFKLFVILPS